MTLLAGIRRWTGGSFAAAAVLPDGVVEFEGEVDAVHALASLTKPLVAMAVLVASEEGTLDLDEPAGPPGSTVRHLLAHASGLDLASDQVLAAPGTRRIYSNHGYEVLGSLLRVRSDLAVDTYVDEAVFAPLGMSGTRLGSLASTGAVGTVRDLARLAVDLMAPTSTVLARSTRDLATAVAFPGLSGVLPGFGQQDANDWGLGFEIRGSKSPHWTPDGAAPDTFGHFGQSGSLLWIDPTRHTGLVVLGDRPFGPWAPPLWRDLGERVLLGAGSVEQPGDESPTSRQKPVGAADGSSVVVNTGVAR